MTRDDIQAALHRDPETIFAVRPGPADTGPVHVRGLSPTQWIERWAYVEFRQPAHPEPERRGWQPASPDALITSRELVEVAAVAQVFVERETVARSRLAELSNTARVVTRLGLLGIDAAQIGRQLVVRDVDALDALLDRVEPTGERAL